MGKLVQSNLHINICEFIEASNSVKTTDELFELFTKASEALGLDRVIFSLMTDHLQLEKPAGHGIILNYPEDWMSYYSEKKYESTDPVRQRMFSSDGPFTWEAIPKTRKQKLFFNQAADAGLLDGIGVPLRSSRGAIAGFGLASSSGGVEFD